MTLKCIFDLSFEYLVLPSSHIEKKNDNFDVCWFQTVFLLSYLWHWHYCSTCISEGYEVGYMDFEYFNGEKDFASQFCDFSEFSCITDFWQLNCYYLHNFDSTLEIHFYSHQTETKQIYDHFCLIDANVSSRWFNANEDELILMFLLIWSNFNVRVDCFLTLMSQR